MATRDFALAGLGAFVLIVAVMHVLDPALSPTDHVISEYVNAPTGWLMIVGFASWAASLLATSVWLQTASSDVPLSRLVGSMLILGALGLVLAATFPTQAVSGSVPPKVHLTTTGRLHEVGSGLSTIALFAAATLVAGTSGRKSLLGRASWLLVGFGLAVQVGLLLVGHEVGGIRQRLLVAGACAWQALVLLRPTPDDPLPTIS